jgi:hypothetical protein
VQLAIRLLVPARLAAFRIAGIRERLLPFDAQLLGYPWRHSDPRVDRLQQEVQRLVSRADDERTPRRDTFASGLANGARSCGLARAAHGANSGEPIPRLSEPWYCCAEPTEQQLQAL